MCALAIGSILVPPLVALGGAELAFAATGALLPAFVLLFYRRLMRVDAAATVPIVEISLLRTTRIFGLLTPPALEGVARNLVPLAVPAGKTIIQQGDEGDRYYVIAGGQVQITIDGAPVARLGRGEGFGEVALLRNAPRTATVTAAVDTDLYALDREPFLIEVTGHAGAAAEAEAVADERANAPCLTGERLAVTRTIGGGAVSSAGRAPALQAGGRWFEPGTAHTERPWKRGLFR